MRKIKRINKYLMYGLVFLLILLSISAFRWCRRRELENELIALENRIFYEWFGTDIDAQSEMDPTIKRIVREWEQDGLAELFGWNDVTEYDEDGNEITIRNRVVEHLSSNVVDERKVNVMLLLDGGFVILTREDGETFDSHQFLRAINDIASSLEANSMNSAIESQWEIFWWEERRAENP